MMNDANTLQAGYFHDNVDVLTAFKDTYLRTLHHARRQLGRDQEFEDYYEVYINIYKNLWEIIDDINHKWYESNLQTLDFYFANNIGIVLDFLLNVSKLMLKYCENNDFITMREQYLEEFNNIYMYIKSYINYVKVQDPKIEHN